MRKWPDDGSSCGATNLNIDTRLAKLRQMGDCGGCRLNEDDDYECSANEHDGMRCQGNVGRRSIVMR